MSWILVLMLIHADGTVTEANLSGFASEMQCTSVGQAWQAEVRKRQDQNDVPVFRCDAKRRKGA